jgi:hypothetical protein
MIGKLPHFVVNKLKFPLLLHNQQNDEPQGKPKTIDQLMKALQDKLS